MTLLAAYAAVVGTVTLLPVSPRPAEGPWWAAIHWLPFDVDAPSFVLNVVLFVPFGVLLPLVRPAADNYRRVAGAALLTSGGIELTQLLLGLLPTGRRTVDVNDLLANTAGALIGLLVLRLAVPPAAHRAALGGSPAVPGPRVVVAPPTSAVDAGSCAVVLPSVSAVDAGSVCCCRAVGHGR